MKASFLAFLAVPVALAAPAASDTFPTTFPFETMKCLCTNEAGDRTTPSSCLNMGGSTIGPEQYCYPSVSWARDMGETFTDDFCFRTDPAMPKAKCLPITLCQRTGIKNPRYYMPC